MRKILLIALLFVSANCLAKDNYKYVGMVWGDKAAAPIAFGVLFETKKECEDQMKSLVALNFKTSKLIQQYSCSSVFLGILKKK